MNPPRIKVKVVMLGSVDVGKTAISNRFIGKDFDILSTSTVGASYFNKEILCKGGVVDMTLWDTAGAERFRSMVPSYYRGADIALIVYSVNDPATLLSAREWIDELLANGGENLKIFLVGNKEDLETKVREQDVEEIAKKYNTECYVVSAKTGKNVDKLFEAIVQKANEMPSNGSEPQQDTEEANRYLAMYEPKKRSQSCC